jgi:uncharacterized protein YjeT (DUF2065 family)
MSKSEMLAGVVVALVERVCDMLMPSLRLKAVAQLQALADEDERLVELSGAPGGYQEPSQ